MTISGFVAYVKQLWKNKPDTSTPLSAERLTHMESGIKGNSDAIEKIAAAVVSQIVNDPNKIASMAALFDVKQELDLVNSDFPVENMIVKSGIASGNDVEMFSIIASTTALCSISGYVFFPKNGTGTRKYILSCGTRILGRMEVDAASDSSTVLPLSATLPIKSGEKVSLIAYQTSGAPMEISLRFNHNIK